MKSHSGSPLAPKSNILHQPFLILLTVATLLLAACGGGASDSGSTSDNPPPSTPADTTPADTTPPVATITGPTGNPTHTTSSATLTLSGSASDNVGVTRVTWVNSRGGSGTATGTTSWSIAGIALQSGTNTLAVTARDAAGNNTTDTLVVTYSTGTAGDTTAPSIAISSPTTGTTYTTTSGTLVLAGSASDNVGVASVLWSNNRGGSGSASGTTSWTTGSITLQSGSNVITVTAVDTGGNVASDTLTVTYNVPDTTAPSISITSPTSGSSYTTTSGSLSLGGTASDNVGVTQITWLNNRGGSGTASGTTSWSIGSITLQGGSNVITVTARDAAGNQNTDTLTVTYDAPPTSSTINYLAPDGSDTNPGTSSQPWSTFAHAFSRMQGGDTLVVRNGTYRQNLVNPPSGSANAYTTIRAESDGAAVIDGGGNVIDISSRSYIRIEGFKVLGSPSGWDDVVAINGTNANPAHHIELLRIGVGARTGNRHGNIIGIGGAHDILLEDCWAYGGGGPGIQLFGYYEGSPATNNIVVRRCVVRKDAGATTDPTTGGMSIRAYGAQDNLFENNITLDTAVGMADTYGAAAAFRNRAQAARNRWYGNIGLNLGKGNVDGFGSEGADHDLRNNIIWGARTGVQPNAAQGTHIVDRILVGNTNRGVSDDQPVIVVTNSIFVQNDYHITGAKQISDNQFWDPNTGTGANAIVADPNILYLPRRPAGVSAGPSLEYRTVNGVETSQKLWPWPYEDRIKTEMCDPAFLQQLGRTGSNTPGWCATSKSLTRYVWEYLGNPLPPGIYP